MGRAVYDGRSYSTNNLIFPFAASKTFGIPKMKTTVKLDSRRDTMRRLTEDTYYCVGGFDWRGVGELK